MQRADENVAAIIEDVERAIARMRVDVEHRDLAEAFAQALRCNGRVVEEAEAVRRVGKRVVSRWAAQTIDHALAFLHPFGSLKRGLRRPVDGIPCAFRQRNRRVGRPPAKLAENG